MMSLLLASLLLHALFIGGLPNWSMPSSAQPPRPLNATIRPLAPMAIPVVQVAEPKPEPVPPAQRPPDKPPVRPVPDAIPAVPAIAAVAAPAEPVSASPPALPVPTAAVPAVTPVTPINNTSVADTNAAARLVRAIPASSATLQYKVVANDPRTDPPRMYFGTGTLAWRADRETYDLDLQVRVNILFVSIGALSSHSQGGVQESGLAPVRYIETPRNRSTMAVNFNRDERNSVTFSTSTNVVPLPLGVQDRLSLLLQLSAIVRANGLLSNLTPEIMLAGTRGSVEPWRFVVVGTENVETGLGSIAALHLRRAARQRSDQPYDDQSMDIWLALRSEAKPADKNANSSADAQQNSQTSQAYPVKIRFADANTTSYELTLEKIE